METAADARSIAAYLRVGTAARAESGVGIAAQRDAIAGYANAQGLRIGEWFDDAGRSGASMRSRAGLQAAITSVETGRHTALVVAKIDRLGRSSADVLGLVERAHKRRWRLVALNVGLETTTPAGELVAAALAMAARFEYRRTSERQNEKHTILRRQGRPRGRAAVAREVADRIRGERDAGATYAAIADRLNREGAATARGAASWSAPAVRSAYLTRSREVEAQTPPRVDAITARQLG